MVCADETAAVIAISTAADVKSRCVYMGFPLSIMIYPNVNNVNRRLSVVKRTHKKTAGGR